MSKYAIFFPIFAACVPTLNNAGVKAKNTSSQASKEIKKDWNNGPLYGELTFDGNDCTQNDQTTRSQLIVRRINLFLGSSYLITHKTCDGSESTLMVDTGTPLSTHKIIKTLDEIGTQQTKTDTTDASNHAERGSSGNDGSNENSHQSAPTAEKRLRYIFITHAHFDHYANADLLAKKYGAGIGIHKNDLESLRTGETDIGRFKNILFTDQTIAKLIKFAGSKIIPGSQLAKGLDDDSDLSSHLNFDQSTAEAANPSHSESNRAYLRKAPGHTAGSAILVVRWKGEDLYFAGDLVSTQGRPRVQSTYAQDWSLLKTELKALIDTDEGPEYMFPGHGKEYLDPQELKKLTIPAMYGKDEPEEENQAPEPGSG